MSDENKRFDDLLRQMVQGNAPSEEKRERKESEKEPPPEKPE